MNARDGLGCTILHLACRDGKTEIVQLLITASKDFSIDLNARYIGGFTWGFTAFHVACALGRTEIVQLLITSSKVLSINLNAKDAHGSTALHVACNYKR